MKPSSAKGRDEKKSRVIMAPEETAKSSQRAKAPFDDLHARISRRAYELYVQRGYREGHADEDWLDAERDILDREISA